ncbi:P-loop containing nucleoside triphosphate hydrolase protein [Aspergillus sclerotiicarbonarius CBS 121057]|uniref:P-loop containing nucleoside triphosphate hydrolase protein n=1 Tax=Aspergillus sclerotiicarbonarius (strain CBS 121057 / IBT 28362) TaxID=1448318 RepID=A0A319EQV7_ASPSB|nr:P-loop containing nucleoside triphosphate hydrolase protein [Aspergillus sclerotiicarbonarius CBS 121057]
MDFSRCVDDTSFGPAVRRCRDNFDFTLKFELLFFAIIPASIFLGLSLPRIVLLARRRVLVTGSWFLTTKLSFIGSYGALHLSLLVLSAIGSTHFRLASLFISSEALSLAAAGCIAILSHLEHSRSQRPSILLSAYLYLSLLLHIAQCRTLWLAATSRLDEVFAKIFTTAVSVEAVIIILESRQKARWLVDDAKEYGPEETSGLYSLSTFMWLNRLFLAGYRKVLELEDLFPLDSEMEVSGLEARFMGHAQQTLHGQKHGLVVVLAKTLLIPLLLPIGPRIAVTGFTFCQAFLVQSVLKFLENKADDSPNLGYGLIGAAILIYAGIAIATSWYWYCQERCLYMARACLGSAIFQKTTQSPLGVAGKSGAITLMSTDIDRILKGFLNLHEFWANLIEIALASWLLERELGVAFVAPIGLVVVSVIAITILGRFIGGRQKAWMEQIQKRVALTATVIASMKHLKISGLADPVETAIQKLRLHELDVGRGFRRLQIGALFLAFLPNLLAPPITLAATGRTLNNLAIFTSTAYLTLLTIPLSDVFRSVAPLMSALACLGRIQSFLEDSPRIDFRDPTNNDTEKITREPSPCGPAIEVVDGQFGWKEGQQAVLKDINLTIPRACLTVIIGPIASGKSTLCKALLGETPVARGQVVVERLAERIGYCDQTPFLFNKTIKENIVGFSQYDPARYAEVIEACLLAHDLALLPRGDDTRVGSNGITLSGGQKLRVSMARALYLASNLLVFDDIFSGLDVDTEEQIFQRVFSSQGLLKRRGTTAILCTHSVRFLPSADQIITLDADGRIVQDNRLQLLATSNRSSIQDLVGEASKWTGSGAIHSSQADMAIPKPLKNLQTQVAAQKSVGDLARKSGDIKVYGHYFRNIPAIPLVAFLVSVVAYGFFYNFPTIWLQYWSDDMASTHPRHSKSFWVGLYALLEVMALFGSTTATLLGLNYMAIRSGAALHLSALRTVTRAPLSFFSKTDLGMVTNHFSQDITLIDGELPGSIINFFTDVAVVIGMAAVLAATSPYMLIAYPFAVAALYMVQRFYLSTSRQIRLLDLEAKSPLYSHFLDTGRGVATIRAFGWTEDHIRINQNLLDTSQRPTYLLAMIQRWLLFTLNVFVLILAVLAVTLSTQLQTSTGFTGSGLLTLMQLGQFMTSVVQCYAKLETSMGAVSRLKAFRDNTSPESLEGEDVVPPPSWPWKGRVEVNRVSASYRASETDPHSVALRELNFVVEPGQKVAICGRTGSGKSSIVLLLLRLLDPLPSSSQNITIDGVALHRVDRSILRQRIIAVPQDVIFLPDGTSFKENLDPFCLSTETECQSILEDLDLWPLVQKQGGLTAGLSPDSLSQGQKQLFSIARAVLRRRVRSRHLEPEGGILLLDEVSSNVDLETDRALRKVIEREFAGYTIIMVSHRLEVVLDFDRVLVLDTGHIVEDGKPRELAGVEKSRFRELLMAASMDENSSS